VLILNSKITALLDDIQQKRIPPTANTMLIAAAGIVTTYTLDVLWYGCGSVLLRILQKFTQSQGHQQSQAIFGRSQFVSLVSALSIFHKVVRN